MSGVGPARSQAREQIRLGAALVIVTMVAPSIQHGVPAMAPALAEDLQLTHLQLGNFTALLFGMSALLAPVMGRAADRLTLSMSAYLCFGFGSLAAMTVSTAWRYEVLLAGAVLGAVPMSLAHPFTNRLLRQHEPGQARAFLVSLKHSGIKVGQALAGLGLAPLATLVGWRAAFAIPALCFMGCAPLLRRAFASPPAARVAPGRRAGRLPGAVAWLVLYSVLMAMSQGAITTYLAVYAYQHVDFSLATAGALAGTLGVSGLVARLIWGWWVPEIGQSVWPLALMAAACIPGTVCIVLSAHVLGAPLLWPAAIALGATTSIWNPSITSIVLGSIPPTSTGRATGRTYFGFCIGMMSGPLLFGLLAERTDGLVAGWAAVIIAQALAALLTIPLRPSLAQAHRRTNTGVAEPEITESWSAAPE